MELRFTLANGGANALHMDGQVNFIKCPGEHPASKVEGILGIGF